MYILTQSWRVGASFWEERFAQALDDLWALETCQSLSLQEPLRHMFKLPVHFCFMELKLQLEVRIGLPDSPRADVLVALAVILHRLYNNQIFKA